MTTMRLAPLLVALLAVLLQQVSSSPLETCRAEIRQRIATLDASFTDNIDDAFYKHKSDAEETGNGALLHFATKVARLELLHYLRERKALMVAGDIVDERFSAASSSGLDSWLPNTRSLADVLISRSIQRACEGELEGEQDLRKTIYALYHAYDAEDHVESIAREHALRIKGKEARAAKAKAITYKALERFQAEAAGQVSEQQVSDVLQLVDELIDRGESRFARSRLVAASERVSRDLAEAARETWNYEMPIALDSISMDIVRAYENGVALANVGEITLEINGEIFDLIDEFSETVRNLFDKPQRMAAATDMGGVPVAALSARMVEFEGLLYASERSMKLTVRNVLTQYLVERNKELDEPLIENANLINIIWQRSTEHALESAFYQTIHLRKEIYVILKRFGAQPYLQRLARRFYDSLDDKEQRYKEANVVSFRLLQRYKSEVSLVAPATVSETMGDDTLRAIDELIHDAATETGAHMDSPQLQHLRLEQLVGADKLAQVMAAKATYQLDNDEVQSIDIREVLAYELEFYREAFETDHSLSSSSEEE